MGQEGRRGKRDSVRVADMGDSNVTRTPPFTFLSPPPSSLSSLSLLRSSRLKPSSLPYDFLPLPPSLYPCSSLVPNPPHVLRHASLHSLPRPSLTSFPSSEWSSMKGNRTLHFLSGANGSPLFPSAVRLVLTQWDMHSNSSLYPPTPHPCSFSTVCLPPTPPAASRQPRLLHRQGLRRCGARSGVQDGSLPPHRSGGEKATQKPTLRPGKEGDCADGADASIAPQAGGAAK